MIQKQKQIIGNAKSHSYPEIAGIRVHIVYDIMNDEDVFRFSRLKHGSGIITRQFSKDLAERINDTLGNQIALAPCEWGIVSIGSSQYLGQVTAKNLGLSYAHIRLDDYSLLNVESYDAAGTFDERNKIFSSKYFTLEKRRSFKAKNAIFVDDMLNRGVTFMKSRDYLEEQHGLAVAGVYVLFSIAHVEDASIEECVSDAFVNAEGIGALIKMINEEDVYITRRLLKSLFYRKDRWRILLALNPRKSLVLISKGLSSMSAKIWVLMKAGGGKPKRHQTWKT